MDAKHKAKIARAKRGDTQTSATKRKISRALTGKPSNFTDKNHNKDTKDEIAAKRGHDDRIHGRKWIVNRFTSKTWRKDLLPNQKFEYGRKPKKFKDWLSQNDK